MKIVGIDFGHGETSASFIEFDENNLVDDVSPIVAFLDNRNGHQQTVIKSGIFRYTGDPDWKINPNVNDFCNCSETFFCLKASPIPTRDFTTFRDDAQREHFKIFIKKQFKD